MSTCPSIRFNVGDQVRLTTASYKRAVDHSRSAVHAGYPSAAFLQDLGQYVGARGTVKYTHPPGYEVTVTFWDGQSFHMKDSWIEPDIARRELYLVVNTLDAEDTAWFTSDNLRRVHRRAGIGMLDATWEGDAISMALEDKTELPVGDGPRRMRRYIMHATEPYVWTDPVTNRAFPRYAIVYPAFIDQSAVSRGGSLEGFFRVVNLWTGSESSLYNLQECERIIMLALSQDLKGSFQ